jgi:type IV secretion system protein TrbE
LCSIHLRRGGYVAKGFIFEAPDLTNSPIADLNDFKINSASCWRRSTKTNGCKSNTSPIPITKPNCSVSAGDGKFENVWTKRSRNERFSRYWQAMSERKLRRQRVIFTSRVRWKTCRQRFNPTPRCASITGRLLDQLRGEFEHVHRLFMEIFGQHRHANSADVRPRPFQALQTVSQSVAGRPI